MHSGTHYYKINRIVLTTLGLWPYQQSYLVRIQNALFIFILITFIMVQLLVLVTAQYNFNVLLRILAYAFPNIFVTMKYCLFIIQADSVRQFLDEVKDDWNSVEDKLEIDILKKYASYSRLITIMMMSFCYIGIVICTAFQLLPIILDIVSPLNESRPYHLIVTTEYFVDQDKYFYAILLHELLTGCIGVIALYGTGTTFMIYVCHACALFKITSHRIKCAFEKSALATCIPTRKCLLYRRIVHTVVIHQRATEFIENLTTKFLPMFLILILVGIFSLTLSLFQFFQLLTLTDNISEMIIFALFIFLNLTYMFIANYGGQEITEHGLQLWRATYNVPWYAAPLPMQKLLLFVMRKETRNVTFSFANFNASLEGFSSMASMAVSYFMVIYTTR